MKTFISTLSVCLVFLTTSIFGQTENTLTLRDKGNFAIPSDNLKEFYTLDISTLELKSFQDAIDYFAEINTDLIFFRPNAEATRASVFLQKNKRPTWTTEDWNAAISKLTLVKN